jgi:hypothetical protein
MKILQTFLALLMCLGVLGKSHAAQLTREFDPPFPRRLLA